jgi:prolyl-tRNA synthetase
VAHVFQLGTRYSEAMDATYVDERGETRPIAMGSYGIGVGRLLACVAQEHHDGRGLVLPAAVAPFQIALLAVGQEEEVGRCAEELYSTMTEAGIDVLFDDRAARPGVKFADADLRGIPLRVTVSRRTLDAKSVELERRREARPWLVALDAVIDTLRRVM